MTEPIDICHVHNSIQDVSMVSDLATRQAQLDTVGRVGILVLFDAEPFEGDQLVDVFSLNIPNDRYRITRDEYRRAKDVLSQFDIVHTHASHASFYGKLIATRLGLPSVSTEHNNHTGFTRKGRIANGITNALADRVICVSESVVDSLKWWERVLLSDDSVEVIDNGVNLERVQAATEMDWSLYEEYDIDEEGVLVGSAGSLSEQKAHDVLIEAVDRANELSEQPIELVISGDGPLRDDLEAQIERTAHSDRIHLLGFLETREHVYKMMDEIDVYAMPSRWEGFCVAALEALAIGNACIFSAIDEFRRPFGDVARYHGIDDPSELAEQIRSLAADEDERCELASAGRSLVVDEYTMERTTERYIETYESVLR